MTKLTMILVAVLATAGCKKTGPGASTASAKPDCGKAIANSMALSKADMQKMGADDAAIAKMQQLGVQHCTDDKWPDVAVTCMIDAKTEQDAQGCYGKLSPEQRDSMNKAAGAK